MTQFYFSKYIMQKHKGKINYSIFLNCDIDFVSQNIRILLVNSLKACLLKYGETFRKKAQKNPGKSYRGLNMLEKKVPNILMNQRTRNGISLK